MTQRWHPTDLHFCRRYVESGIATVYHIAQIFTRQLVPPSTLLFVIWLCVIIIFFVCVNCLWKIKHWVVNPESDSGYCGGAGGNWVFPHDLNAASDDESRSAAADSQVWSAAGRHSDRGGHLVDSTGTESTRTPERFCQHDRQSTELTRMTQVSFLPFFGKLWFGLKLGVFLGGGWVLVSLARKAEAGPETVIPDWITITPKLLPFSVLYLKRTPNVIFYD